MEGKDICFFEKKQSELKKKSVFYKNFTKWGSEELVEALVWN